MSALTELGIIALCVVPPPPVLPEPKKFCVDCGNYSGDFICVREVATKFSMVTGTLVREYLTADCRQERESAEEGFCGNEGRFWEKAS